MSAVHAETEQEAFQKAHQDYLEYLTVASLKFEDALIALQEHEPMDEALKSAKSVAHKLAGSALMFGFASLGDEARDLQNMLIADDYLRTNEEILVKIDKILEKISEIFDTTDLGEGESTQGGRTVQEVLEASPARGTSHLHDRMSIMLIYNDPWTSSLMASMLEPEFKIIECHSVEQAKITLSSSIPNLIVTEAAMGESSGLDLTRYCREQSTLKAIPIVVVLDNNEPDAIVRAMQAGATDCFTSAHDVLPIVTHIRTLVQRKRSRVLIVDDDAAVRDLLRHRFRSHGLRADIAIDGIEALSFLKNNKPDLIVLDRMMPRLGGGAVLHEIQNEINLKKIPVMIISALANRKEATAWLKRGASDFIAKPFDPEEVVIRALRRIGLEKAEE